MVYSAFIIGFIIGIFLAIFYCYEASDENVIEFKVEEITQFK